MAKDIPRFGALLERRLSYTSQASLALECGVPQSTVSRWRSGSLLPRHHLQKVATALDVTLDELVSAIERSRL